MVQPLHLVHVCVSTELLSVKWLDKSQNIPNTCKPSASPVVQLCLRLLYQNLVLTLWPLALTVWPPAAAQRPPQTTNTKTWTELFSHIAMKPVVADRAHVNTQIRREPWGITLNPSGKRAWQSHSHSFTDGGRKLLRNYRFKQEFLTICYHNMSLLKHKNTVFPYYHSTCSVQPQPKAVVGRQNCESTSQRSRLVCLLSLFIESRLKANNQRPFTWYEAGVLW